MKNIIYLDNAASAKTSPQVLNAMLPYFCDIYANPSGAHDMAHSAEKAVSRARLQAARLINASPSEIYFTSGGSESDNWAVISTARCNRHLGRHIITTAIEHNAILKACRQLENEGFDITYVKPDSFGRINPDEILSAIRFDTILISVMTANNEVGTIQPIRDIGAIAAQNHIIFHTDAVQACGHIPINVRECNIDLLSTSAHKFHGPKGIGFLFIKKGTKTTPMIYGGSQEMNMRAGTSNVPGIVGLGEAAEIAMSNMNSNYSYTTRLRNHMINRIKTEIPNAHLNGHPSKRLPNNVSFCFEGVESAQLLAYLNSRGICASAGSACSTGAAGPSHVLTAMGISPDLAGGAIRFTLSEENNIDEINYAVNELVKILRH